MAHAIGNIPGKVPLDLMIGDAISLTLEIFNADGSPATVGTNWTAGIYNDLTLIQAIAVGQASNVLTLSLTGAQTSNIPLIRKTFHWLIRDDDNDKTYANGRVDPSIHDGSYFSARHNNKTVTVSDEDKLCRITIL
jgi:hypothetical protein